MALNDRFKPATVKVVIIYGKVWIFGVEAEKVTIISIKSYPTNDKATKTAWLAN